MWHGLYQALAFFNFGYDHGDGGCGRRKVHCGLWQREERTRRADPPLRFKVDFGCRSRQADVKGASKHPTGDTLTLKRRSTGSVGGTVG
jgi:hypothetical protein